MRIRRVMGGGVTVRGACRRGRWDRIFIPEIASKSACCVVSPRDVFFEGPDVSCVLFFWGGIGGGMGGKRTKMV